MPQLGQWLWACPFLAVLGENFFSLRASTIVLSWLGLWACYDLLKQEGLKPTRAAFLSACLAFNPLFFVLEGTYMTDVPALSFALLALAFYGRGLLRGGRGNWLTATLFAVLAGITRQNGIVVPLVAAVQLASNPKARRQVAAWLATFVPILATLYAHNWFQHLPDVRALQPSLPEPFVLLLFPFALVHLLGLSVLPVLVVDPRPGSWKTLIATAVVLAGCVYYWIFWRTLLPYRGGLFPYTHNMITPWGAFEGGYIGQLEVGRRPIVLGWLSRLALTILGCIGGAWLIARSTASLRGYFSTGILEQSLGRRAPYYHDNLMLAPSPVNILKSPLLLFALGQIPFLFLAPEIYDRYLLAMLTAALFLAGATMTEAKPHWSRGFVVLAVFAAASVGLMHDWLAWNSARWELGRRAVDERKFNPWDIEGGFEWDGWFAPARAVPGKARAAGLTRPFTRDWFSHVTGKYALAFSPVPGSVVLDQEPYVLWLVPGRHEMYLIEQRQKP
jgi:hypothetical protein